MLANPGQGIHGGTGGGSNVMSGVGIVEIGETVYYPWMR